jgi:predicted metal-dependent HD superfamily phosphohydrolase
MKFWYIFFLALEWRRVHRDLPKGPYATRGLRWDEFQRIVRAYSEKWRHYHVLRHIYLTVKMARECYKEEVNPARMSQVVMALIYHDVVYVIGSKTNEEDSAAQWRRYADGRFAPDIIEFVNKLIIMTKSHKLDANASLLEKIMNDCDMGILSADEDEYLKYAQNIWREYRAAGPEAYRAGRLAFLKSLNVHEMFHTNVPETYIAELNVSDEIELLEYHPERIMVD